MIRPLLIAAALVTLTATVASAEPPDWAHNCDHDAASCDTTTTTTPDTTTTEPTTTLPDESTTTLPDETTTTPPTTTPPVGRFTTLPVGASLPSGAVCASQVRPAAEIRPSNAIPNANRGSRANANTRTDWAGFNRVDGDFAGTTDQIIQWAACKWGIDEDIVRAQVIKESYWYQSVNGDNGESWGLGQVRDTYHQSAFQFAVNARTSSAYNLDYTYASWRACYEGVYTWLNSTTERNGTYAAGDVWGCVGIWFSGRWYFNNDAYLNQTGDSVRWHYDNKTWLTSSFINHDSTPTPPTTQPAVTTSTTTTIPPPTTIPTPPTTVAPPTGTQFIELFTGNTGLERFDFGIHHRDNSVTNGTEQADHDLACGNPSTQRTVYAADKASSFYMCADHLMTAIGDWATYSIGWFMPKQTFTNVRSVSWDVNVTDLGARKWWEVAVMPVGFDSGQADCRYCSVVAWLSPSPSNMPAYPQGSVVVGSGPFGNTPHVRTDEFEGNPTDWQHICGDPWALDPEGYASKMIRRPFTITDNGNGTITLIGFGRTMTIPGRFPPGDVKVIFKDHNYTPDKDGPLVGHTWHWDSVLIQ